MEDILSEKTGVSILGIFVADTAYLAARLPRIGETIIGSDFKVGPGGKGSNQAVAAARAGAKSALISKIGNDTFGHMALETYAEAGVTAELTVMPDKPTGAAFIFVNDENGDNAIIVYPGAAGTITVADVEAKREVIEHSRVFVTQLEQPADAALCGLNIARASGVTTVFNPAPAESFPEEIFALCDFIVPNETEAGALVGYEVNDLDTARQAAQDLRTRGAGAAVITLGSKGVYVQSDELDLHVPAICNASVVETTGAGDAFVGGFSAALSKGQSVAEAVRFGCATAGIAVTRRGTAPAMPYEAEILDLLNEQTA